MMRSMSPQSLFSSFAFFTPAACSLSGQDAPPVQNRTCTTYSTHGTATNIDAIEHATSAHRRNRTGKRRRRRARAQQPPSAVLVPASEQYSIRRILDVETAIT